MSLYVPHLCQALLLWRAITLPSPYDTHLCHLLWSCLAPRCSFYIRCAGAEISWSLLHQKHTHEHLPKQVVGEKIGTNLVPHETGIGIPNPTCLTAVHVIPALCSGVVSNTSTCLQPISMCFTHLFSVLWGSSYFVLQAMQWFPCYLPSTLALFFFLFLPLSLLSSLLSFLSSFVWPIYYTAFLSSHPLLHSLIPSSPFHSYKIISQILSLVWGSIPGAS